MAQKKLRSSRDTSITTYTGGDAERTPAAEVKIGKIHDSKTLFFRIEVGAAATVGVNYELALCANTNVPIVRSGKTGKWFTLAWGDIVNLAIKAGINGPDIEV